MPNRIVKESIRTSKSVNALSDFQFRVWIYLITYVDDYGRGSADPELLKGLVFTRRKGVTEQQISKALADLATIGMITLYQVDGESLLCFPNWDKHQRIQTKKSKFPAPQDFTVNHGGSPPESESESESESRIQNTPPITPQGESVDDGFDRFWGCYPKKVGKGYAFKVWKKINPSKSLTEQIISAVEEQKKSEQWKKEDGQYIPNPATWLNQGRWEDDLNVKTGNRSYDIDEMERFAFYDLPDEL